MRILSITAQKPNSTGSGVYLTELVKEYALLGHEQAVVAGVYREDEVELPDGVDFYPVYFCEEGLLYPIVGMSDEMPYISTKYSEMSPEMVEQFRSSFMSVIERAVEELQPDLILCHHLYLLTALVREHFPERKVYGFCHNTDLRQMQKTDLEREFIRRERRRKGFLPCIRWTKRKLPAWEWGITIRSFIWQREVVTKKELPVLCLQERLLKRKAL